MRHEKDALDRLFKAAKNACPQQNEGMPFAIETRVLALRRSSPVQPDDLVGLLGLFRRGLAVAGLIALVTIWICLPGDENALPAMDVTVLDSVDEISSAP
jgi:hypothetical protein